MSSYPPNQTQAYYYQPPPANALGVAGFVVSLSGLIVCFGLICPIGLVLSLIALGKTPRGYAIAGTIIGLIGSLIGGLFIFVYFGIISSGFFFSQSWAQSQTSYTLDNASWDIDSHFSQNNDTLPDEPTGDTLIASYTDEWGNNLKYTPTPGSTTNYTITSPGPDAQFNTADDITQYYTAHSWNAPATQAVPHAIGDEQIAAAFNNAASKIIASFPPEAPLPDESAVNDKAGVLPDAWGTPLRYSPTDSPPMYHLKSAGPDKQWNTHDDITRSFYFAPAGESDGPL